MQNGTRLELVCAHGILHHSTVACYIASKSNKFSAISSLYLLYFNSMYSFSRVIPSVCSLERQLASISLRFFFVHGLPRRHTRVCNIICRFFWPFEVFGELVETESMDATSPLCPFYGYIKRDRNFRPFVRLRKLTSNVYQKIVYGKI